MEAACRGDVESFAHLYRRYFAMASGIAFSVLFDRDLAEDAAQESFAEACRHLHELQDRRKFSFWLGTICRRISGRMANSRDRPRSLSFADQQRQAPVDEVDDRIALIRDAVRILPVSEKEAIILHYFSQLSYDEIALVLNTTPAAVHGRLSRARRRIRQALQFVDKRGTAS